MKKIRNWKVYQSGVSLKNALEMLKDGKTIGGQSPIAIKNSNTGKFIDTFSYGDISFTPNEIHDDWLILVPDNDEEQKNEKIRKMMKESNCSGCNYDKIDNMTISDIWRHIAYNLDNNQMYRMLLYFYENKIFKTK